MTNRHAANRYARALLDVLIQEKQVDPRLVEAELAGFVELLRQNPALDGVLLNPVVPAARKGAVIDAIAKRTKTTPVLAKLLMLLAERDRLAIVPELLAAYRERLLDHLHVVRAEITTAAPLPPGQAEAVEQTLARSTGRQVALETRVDPAIIGGVVARVDGTVYDGSVAGQLQRMKERLTTSQ